MSDDGERKPIRIRGISHAARDSSPVMPPPVSLGDPQLDPEFRLKAVLDMSRRAWDEYEEAIRVADEYGIGTLPSMLGVEDLEAGRERCRTEVRKRYNRWMDLQGQLSRAESDVRRRKLERPMVGVDQAEFEKIQKGLLEEYAGLGMHYDLLCTNCASLTVRLRRMETSGRDYESQEYTDLHKLYLSYINQLQKYTEAMKSETITKQTQEVALRIIQVFESHFGMQHPREWNEAVAELKTIIEEAA